MSAVSGRLDSHLALPWLPHLNPAIMTFPSFSPRCAFAAVFALMLLSITPSWGQRSGSKSTKIDITTLPTVRESIVDKVAFFVHADPNFHPR